MTEPITESAPISEDVYRINLDVFEGPLDLLLHLIKKDDLDICDIPISLITQRYLEYIESMEKLDIDLAAEFLLMAAELTHIKSKMLLPSLHGEEEEELEDPRADLMRRLLEYQRYKEVAGGLVDRTQLNRDTYLPLSPETPPISKDVKIEGNVYHLIEAFEKVIRKSPEEAVHGVTVDRISINERIYQILDILKLDETVDIDHLLPRPLERHVIVITFLSLLEMSRLKMIKVYQGGLLEKLYITKTVEEIESNEAAHLIDVEGSEG
jgi:segregation and condensation protein A